MNQIPRWPLLAVLLALAVSPFARAQQKTPQDKPQQIDALLQQYYNDGQFNGSALVARGGTVIFKKGYGEANKEWGIMNTPDTKFRLGSITKQFTSMLIMQLVEQGKIRLDATVSDYLPEYPPASGKKITIQHLLTHSSGIPSYTDQPNFQRDFARTPFTPQDFIKTFWNLPLEFEPGTRFQYSNSGYFLLGVIIEKVTSVRYARLLDEKIFKPLGMVNSGYDMPGPILPKRAAGYQKLGGTVVNASYIDMTVPYSAGSLYSTVEDLFVWDQALYGTSILGEAAKDQMFQPRIATEGISGYRNQYAFGWVVSPLSVGSDTGRVNSIWHGGSINGFNSLIVRVPETRTLIVLLNNTGGTRLSAMARSILGIVYDKPYGGVVRSVANVVRYLIERSGIDAAETLFRQIRNNEDDYALSEGEMNNLGYEFIQMGKTKEAIAVFRLNVEAFPESFNAYDSLGEAYAGAGEKDLAIKNYEKSVELNPKSQSGIDALKKLKAK